ncbi:NAD(P)-dependent oxidoreductase [Curtobacterium sp. MWU13-2055]|uniref:NAD(P)-dependent oxidoreductase n=1 Tax=Curtobacterium sp. MWU13-2055 TaxID=2931928 RepID=UPI00200EA13F|nr:NAD(P)-binding oxidoreductase [Curtobacterium sp. MWU13-2055]
MSTTPNVAPLQITVLGASGATGLQLVRQALDRGHTVVAVARRPERIDVPDGERLLRRAGDVTDPDSIAEALRDSTIVVSGLGVVGGERGGVLSAGARAVIAARPERMVWLGAFGTGPSAASAGPLTRSLLRVVLRAEIEDKVRADALVLGAGGSVVHAGPLSNRPESASPRGVLLSQVPRRLFPASISRASVASVMLDAAQSGVRGVIVPLINPVGK